MKIIFAGTPEFSVPTLEALINSPHEVVAVYTQPDRPKGRGRHLAASPIKELAVAKHIPVEQPLSLKKPEIQAQLAQYAADVMVVVAYGLILPKAVLDLPKYGCINVHASLLPRWRGASPIQQAILAGDKKSGVTIMQMDIGLDNGDMLLQKTCEIHADETAQTLHDRLSEIGASALLQTLDLLAQHKLQPEKQDEKLVTHAPKINKTDAKINWQLSAIEIERQVRGYNPWPIAFCELNGAPVRIWQAKAINESVTATPGSVIGLEDHAIIVATGEGLLAIEKLQLAGGKPITAQDFINGLKEKNNEMVFS